jgi:eukaryotic-like serine/threonine-protein kinase
MPLPAGTRLGPYEIVAAIGAGGMGEVYKAHDPRLNRHVAIKVLGADVAAPDALERFEQEARAASKLNHPNILTVHDVGREGGVFYFAMEWVDGRTLRDILRAGRLPLRRALEIAHQVAEGLAKAHVAGVVHRDLKPENVMVSADGFAKIVDFGLAKLVQGTASEAVTRVAGTSPGLVMGSAGYMSPEQASGREVDYRSDQFALGLLIYEMTTGVRPFARETTAQMMAATIDDEPEPIEQRNPDVPAHLASVVARCLAKEPAERYESTRDLARDLKQILEAQSRGYTAARSAGPAWSRAALLAAAVVVLAIVTVAAWFWRSSPTPPGEPERPLVAVQAFRNLSPEPDQAYFAAGMTEEIRGQLSKVSGLRLLSRSAVETYAGADLSRMVRELGVNGLVEGTVRIDGARVRIAATLIDAATHETLWSDQYDRQLADVFEVQSDVAVRIAQALHASLSADERARGERRPTENLEAYQLYLKSMQLSSAGREQNLAGIDLLDQALALDPEFALARATLAIRLFFLGSGDSTRLPRALEEARRAVESDPELPLAHFALGSVYTLLGRAAQGRMSFLQGLELDSSHTGGLNNLSILEWLSGRNDESLYWARRAFALSARRGNDFFHVAVPLVTLDGALAREWLVDAERLAPPHPRVQALLAMLDAMEGRAAEARQRIDAATARWPGNDELLVARANVAFTADAADAGTLLEALMHAPDESWGLPLTVRLRVAHFAKERGDARRAAELIAEAERLARERIEAGEELWQPALELAAVAVLRGDQDEAFEWLARGFDAGYRQPAFLERNVVLAPLAGHSRFAALTDRMRADNADQRARARERGLLDLKALLPE